ncbi:MAG TPA: cytochrome c oxidase assembly factor Coa1 family protein [Candidatus Binataceae bacterium]|nr:cytochrome c oxidase assembly factor Coa1 family protein [Candidatus Binataceae bacterium]
MGVLKMLRSIRLSPDAKRAFEGWFVIFLMMIMLGELYLRSSTPAAIAMQFAQHNAAVQDAIGNVEHARLNWIGNIHYDGTDGWASFKMHLTGARANGTMDLTLERQRGEWNVAAGRIVTDNGQVVTIGEDPERASAP